MYRVATESLFTRVCPLLLITGFILLFRQDFSRIPVIVRKKGV